MTRRLLNASLAILDPGFPADIRSLSNARQLLQETVAILASGFLANIRSLS